MLLAEAKKKWNLMVFESIAKEFDRKTADRRGDKGACAAAGRRRLNDVVYTALSKTEAFFCIVS